MKTRLSDEKIAKDAVAQAWSELSEEYEWTESLLEKYQDHLDWRRVSENHQIKWNRSMLDRYKDLLDWTVLSKEIRSDQITEDLLEIFKDRWDWEELSDNWHLHFSLETITKFADYWDWESFNCLGCRVNTYDEDPVAFYERFQQYISKYRLKHSNLWDKIVETYIEQIEQEIENQI